MISYLWDRKRDALSLSFLFNLYDLLFVWFGIDVIFFLFLFRLSRFAKINVTLSRSPHWIYGIYLITTYCVHTLHYYYYRNFMFESDLIFFLFDYVFLKKRDHHIIIIIIIFNRHSTLFNRFQKKREKKISKKASCIYGT